MIGFIRKYLRSHRGLAALAFFISIVTSITGMAIPYINGVFLDSLIREKTYSIVLLFALMMCILGGFEIISTFFLRIILTKLSARIEYEIDADIVSHIQKTPYITYQSYYSSPQISQQAVSDSGVITQFISQNLTSFFLNIFVFVVVLVMLYFINVPTFFVSIAFLPVYALSFLFLRKPVYEANFGYRKSQTVFYNIFFEQVHTLLDTKIKADFTRSQERLESNYKFFYKKIMRNAKISQIFSSLDIIISIVFQIIVLLLGGYQIVSNKMTIGEYTIVNTYFIILLKVVKYYFGFGKSYQDSKVAYDRILKIHKINMEYNGNIKIDSIDNIIADHVSFSYCGENCFGFHDKTWIFQKNKVYCLKGLNGSGKTTFINILIGIIQDLSGGEIRINGIKSRDIDMYFLRRNRLSVLSQTHCFPDMTVKEYLIYETNMSLKQIHLKVESSDLAQIYVNSSFDYRNFLNKKIDALSGGEKQKIRLLQVLIKAADVIILDEPTSFLDADSIENLSDFLYGHKQNRITIIADHSNAFDEITDETFQC